MNLEELAREFFLLIPEANPAEYVEEMVNHVEFTDFLKEKLATQLKL